MPNLSKPAALGLLSSAALLLGACSYTSPQSSGYGYNHASYTTHHAKPGSHYHASTTRTYAPNYGTTYAPRASYSAAPTRVSYGAPYGSAVRYGSASPAYYGGPALRRSAGYTYGSVGAVMYDVEQEAFGVQGRLGYQATPLLGAEIEGSVGLLDDTTGGVNTEYDYAGAGFATASLPLGPRMKLQGRGGYHFTRIDQTPGATTTEEGLAYGAGIEYGLNARDSLRLDYTIYEIDGGAPNLDAVSLGYQRKF